MRTIRFLAPLWLAVLGLTFGCSSTKRPEAHLGGTEISGAPFFVTGPAALLFTTYGDFSARVRIDSAATLKDKPLTTGAFLGQGSKVLFGPIASKKGKPSSGDNSYIWDAKNQKGFVVSEPLQGYAPLSTNVFVTNIAVARIEHEAPETIDGHDCRAEQTTFQLSDGSTVQVNVLRAKDLNGFPMRVEMMTGYPRQVATFSDVEFGHVAADLFAPPDGFTRYENLGQMETELIIRKSKPKKNFVGNMDTGPLPNDHDYSRGPR